MSKYAEGTKVPVARSRAEIEQLLQRYGAEQFISGWGPDGSVIGFMVRTEEGEKRQVRLTLPLPDRDGFNITEQGRERSETAAHAAWEKECRRSWRALALVIKAKLEAVATGISTIQREFLADIVMANNMTMGEWSAPQIAGMYESAQMPKLLPGRHK